MVYKLCTPAEAAEVGPVPWPGSSLDQRDGFVHLSARDQVAGTLATWFVGAGPLVLLVVDPARLPDGALRWEASRGGALFPHLHAPLDGDAVVRRIALADDHRLPDDY